MLSDPWRLRPAVPDVIGDDVSSDDDDDYYDDSGLADAYEIARKVREANARLRADITPLESSRQRRVQFRDPIRAVFFFTPDGGEENGEEDEDEDDDGEEDEDEGAPKAEDALARSGPVRRLVTAAVERRSSLTSEEPDEPSSAVMMTAGGPEGADHDDVDDDFEQGMAHANDSGDDVDSFESDDNPSVSEDISELSSEGKDDNQEASVQEASGAADAEDDRRSPDAGSTASASSNSADDRPALKPANSWDSSLEEAASSTVQEGPVNFDLGGNDDDSVDAEAAASGAPTSVTEPEVTLQSPVRSGDTYSMDGNGKPLEQQAAFLGPLPKESPVAKPRVAADRPSTSPATLTAIYGASPRPRPVVTAGRIGGGAARGALTTISASRGRQGSVPNEADQRARSSWNRATRQTSLQLSARSARSVPSSKPTAKSAEHGPRQQLSTRGSTPKQVQRRPPLAKQDRASSADDAMMASNMASTTVVSGSRSTYSLPRELKEELMRKKRRERELRLQRQAREESERRQRALEAEQAFRAWLTKKRREESLTRPDSLASRDDDSSQSESSRSTDADGKRAASSGAFEAWLRRKQRQQREDELRRTLRELDLAATDKPRRSRHEAQQVYLAWLERKYEEERQRRLTALAERRGGREAALSARSLRILERYLRSEEFARYPELVV